MKKLSAVFVAIILVAMVAGIALWQWGNIPLQLSQSPSMVWSLEEEINLKGMETGSNGALKTRTEPEVSFISTEKPTLEKYTVDDYFSEGEAEFGCYYCHDAESTKGFHVPEKIVKIEASEGKRRRICPDCHGLEGADPDKQMTDPRYIQFDVNASVNGLYKLSKGVPHAIHKRILVSGAMECIACHLRDSQDYTTFNMLIPEADTEDGQILLCQNCKFHPERGNYIAIHMEVAEKTCTTCHTGDLLVIHRKATSKLGTP